MLDKSSTKVDGNPERQGIGKSFIPYGLARLRIYYSTDVFLNLYITIALNQSKGFLTISFIHKLQGRNQW